MRLWLAYFCFFYGILFLGGYSGDEETSESSAEFPKAFSLSSKDMGGSTSGFSISPDNPHTGDTLALQVQYDLLGVF